MVHPFHNTTIFRHAAFARHRKKAFKNMMMSAIRVERRAGSSRAAPPLRWRHNASINSGMPGRYV